MLAFVFSTCESNPAHSNLHRCGFGIGQPLTGYGMYCVNDNVCTASGGEIGFDGICHYTDGRSPNMILKTHNEVQSQHFTQASARNPAMADSIKNTMHIVNNIVVTVYETKNTADDKVVDLYQDGTFSFPDPKTAFVLFGKRVTGLFFLQNNNQVFLVPDVNNIALIDNMLDGLKEFKKITVVLGFEDINLKGFLKALELYPISDSRKLAEKCGDHTVTWDYAKLAEAFLKSQELWVLSDLWRWFNRHAVDFSRSRMDKFQTRDDFVSATKDISKMLTLAEKMDLTDWTKRGCRVFQQKIKEMADDCVNQPTKERTLLHNDMHKELESMTYLKVPLTWQKGFQEMIREIMDQDQPKTCILVFGEKNNDCRFSVVKLWQAAQTLLQVRIILYGEDTCRMVIDICMCLAMLCIGYKVLAYLDSSITKNRQEDSETDELATDTDELATQPPRMTTRSQSRARGKSPKRSSTKPKSCKSSTRSNGTSTWGWFVNLLFNRRRV